MEKRLSPFGNKEKSFSIHRKRQSACFIWLPPTQGHTGLPHNTVEAVLEPLDGLVVVDLVVDTDLGLAAAALGDVLTGTGPIQLVSSLKPTIQSHHQAKTHMQQ